MNLPPPSVCRKVRKLHAMLGSSNEKEHEAARGKLLKLLAEYGASWNDLPTILSAADSAAGTASAHASPSADVAATGSVNVLDLVMRLIEEHVATTPAECLATALWVLHTYVFDQYRITPRLAILSPVRACGKSSLIDVLELLSSEPFKVDDVSAAAIYHQLERWPRTTWLIDEGDNLGLLDNRVLRNVFNGGHKRGGRVSRFVGGWSRKFPTFAPLAIAAIGATETLPLPLLHRSVIINMQRFAPSADLPELKKLDDLDPAFAATRDEIRKWAATCQLAPSPEMPTGFFGRPADNWRVLLAIADALNHGEEARAAAIALSSNRPDEDAAVTLLENIRTVFAMLGRIPGAAVFGLDRSMILSITDCSSGSFLKWLTWSIRSASA